MEALRAVRQSKGFPRQKVFYEFQLYGVSSKRMAGGIRGGYSCVWEEWELPGGFCLLAIKHMFVGNDYQFIPLKDGESFLVQGRRLMMKEKYYHEPRLEPYFDTIRLIDGKDRLVSELTQSPK